MLQLRRTIFCCKVCFANINLWLFTNYVLFIYFLLWMLLVPFFYQNIHTVISVLSPIIILHDSRVPGWSFLSEKRLSCLSSLFISTLLYYYSLDKMRNGPQVIPRIIKTVRLRILGWSTGQVKVNLSGHQHWAFYWQVVLLERNISHLYFKYWIHFLFPSGSVLQIYGFIMNCNY